MARAARPKPDTSSGTASAGHTHGLLFGFHPIVSRLRMDPDSITEVVVAEGRRDARLGDLLDRATAAGVAVRQAPVDQLERLAGGRHQGVIALVSRPARRVDLDDVLAAAGAAARLPLLLLLDEVQDPHNLGACLRNADALGADAVVIPKDRSVGLTPAVMKVASGAADTVPLVTVTNLARTIDELKARDVWIIGADAGASESLFSVPLDGPIAWVLGAEGRGLRRLTRDKCDRLVRIPQFGSVSSLNVSVAAGICLFATQQFRDRAG